MSEGRHNCNYDGDTELPHDGYGAAVTTCIEDEEGKFWVANGEYGTQVFYCPFCGAKAPTEPIPYTYERSA
jgi:hypothetical protein